MQTSEEDTLQLSFLDVLSCGLGAAVLLFLVFSVIGAKPPESLSAPQFITIWGQFEPADAEIRLFLRPPEPMKPRMFCVGANSAHCRPGTLANGRLTNTDAGAIFPQLAPDSANPRHFTLRILEPATGLWRFTFRYDTARRPVSSDLMRKPPDDLTMELKVWTRSSRMIPFNLQASANRLADCSSSPTTKPLLDSKILSCGPPADGGSADAAGWMHLTIQGDERAP